METRPSAYQLAAFRRCFENFVPYSDKEWDLIASECTLIQLEKRDHYVHLGEISTGFAFIYSGSVRSYLDRDGEAFTNYFSFAGELTSSYSSFLTQMPSRIAIEALEETQLIEMSHHSLDLLTNNPILSVKMERFGRKVAEYLSCCYEDRLLTLLMMNPEERYLNLLKSSGSVFNKIPQHYIAHYLGVTPVSLSRIRNRSRRITV